MVDPYKVLGISPNATDAQVKEAYRALAKKYHPDNYIGNPIADLATEKMKEINEAYDTIMAQRRRGAGNTGTSSAGNPQAGSYNRTYSSSSSNSSFGDVRNLIMAGRVADAEQILNGVPGEQRNAEWNFLKGTVLYKRGWLEESYNHFSRACQMDPSNLEYRAAMNQAVNQRNGSYGGYNPSSSMNGCSTCDLCTTLWCADCCCECAGGDLISCC